MRWYMKLEKIIIIIFLCVLECKPDSILAMGKLKNIKLSNVWFIFVFNSLVEGWWWMCELKVSSFFTSVLFTFCGLQSTNNWAL